MTFKKALRKQQLELFLIYPIVLLGRIYGYFTIPQKKYTHFFFFPSADIGGSIKVNVEIVECLRDKTALIIFSKIPKNNKFKHLFKFKGVDVIDLSKRIDNKLYHFINIFYRGVLSVWINKSTNAVVLGGEALYFYKILPHLQKTVKTVEVCHLNTWFNYTLGFLKKIDVRVFSTPKIKRDAEALYIKSGVPDVYFSKLFFVDNKVAIPEFAKINNPLIEVLYVGRGAAQKRVYLIEKIALLAQQKNLAVHFTFVGDVASFFTGENKNCTLLGEINDRETLEKIYEKSDSLILTSAYEGLPLVVMDMMARGRIVISTAVDGIPDYIKHLQTGLLIENRSEQEIVEDAVKLIEFLIANPNEKSKIESNAYQFAKSHFSNEVFDRFYKKNLENEK